MEELTETEYRKFIPQSVVSFEQVELLKQTLNNDVYQKYDAATKVNGEYIVCKDPKKLKKKSKKLVKENYEEYLMVLDNRDPAKDLWIYNILDGVAEQDKILYQDKHFILLPTFTFDGKSVEKMHLLALPRDKTLRSIRDLRGEHRELLDYMKEVTLAVIQSVYGLQEENLKMFFHYEPSTYHLHIHFVNLEHAFGSSVEYSHDLDLVIYNLSLSSEYYKHALLNTRVAL